MTQYRIDAINPDHRAYVGWDPPLNTFFLHVVDTKKEEDDPKRDVVWIGCRPSEIHDVDVIMKEARKYAEVPSELTWRLYADANG